MPNCEVKEGVVVEDVSSSSLLINANTHTHTHTQDNGKALSG